MKQDLWKELNKPYMNTYVSITEEDKDILKDLLELLMDLYLKERIFPNEYNKIDRLLLSTDEENKVLGAKIPPKWNHRIGKLDKLIKSLDMDNIYMAVAIIQKYELEI